VTGTKTLAPGVWGVLATPFRGPTQAVDHRSLRTEVESYRQVGAAGVVALGVFGEAASLSADEQADVAATVADASGGMPLVVGLSARPTAPAVELAKLLCEAAGDTLIAVMAQVNSSDPELLRRHLDTLHGECGAAVVVQDYPAASGVTIMPDVLAAVVARCPYIAAIKCEAPPTALAISVLAGSVSAPLFGGLGGVGLIDELAAGAAGAMTGFSYPEGLVAALRAHAVGGFDAAREAFSPWLPLANFENQPGIGLAIRKETLRRRGLLAESTVRSPAPGFPAELAPLLERHLRALPAAARGDAPPEPPAAVLARGDAAPSGATPHPEGPDPPAAAARRSQPVSRRPARARRGSPLPRA
jgi:4-hydroxy-tetrahydrodipicolinate synthase